MGAELDCVAGTGADWGFAELGSCATSDEAAAAIRRRRGTCGFIFRDWGIFRRELFNGIPAAWPVAAEIEEASGVASAGVTLSPDTDP